MLALLVLLVAGSVWLITNKKEVPQPAAEKDSVSADIRKLAGDLYASRVSNAKTEAEKNDAQLSRASYYYDQKDYSVVANILTSMKIESLTEDQKTVYYRLQAELAIQNNDFKLAQSAVEQILTLSSIKDNADRKKLWQGWLDMIKSGQDPFVPVVDEGGDS